MNSLQHGGPAAAALVADDDPLFRALVSELLQRLSLTVVEAGSGAEALEAARASPPVLVVLDVRLPDVSGLVVCRELREELGEGLPVVFVSGEKRDDLDRAAGLLLGADDYFVKPLEPTVFIARARRLLSRPRVTTEAATGSDGVLDITPREREVLALLAGGDNRVTIAEKLVISPRTVGSHIQHVFAKLGVHSQAQAVAVAFRHGLVVPAAAVTADTSGLASSGSTERGA